ncbi:chitinase-3-like protein 2 [Littorina saxatilis]|uniref:GH18 domain-containing protein n=1 Tax=Littorina saxatilis TaxID=31220 RepID=A0AAN9AKL0_9CAEN
MNIFLSVLLVGTTALFAGGAQGGDFVVMCYFTNWSTYRAGVGRFVPEDIEPNLCTHILYAFATVHPTALTVVNGETNEGDIIGRVNSHKSVNPDLKVLVALGGAGGSNEGFDKASSSDENRRLFAVNVVAYLRQFDFDGVDMDWEKPLPAQRVDFTLTLAALRKAFDEEAASTGKPRLLLTGALWQYKPVFEEIYEVDKIHEYLDLVAVMAYDYHGTWGAQLGHNSPLYDPEYERGGTGFLSQNGSMFWWEKLGCPREKLVMGLATYGRTFKMTSSDLNKPGDLYEQGETGDGGPHTQTPGQLAYYEVCQLLNAGFKSVFTEDSKVPYAYGERGGHWEWISYDNVQSMHVKSNYIVNTGLGGAMFWNLDYDDFRHTICGQGRYPLITTVSNILLTATRTTTTTTTPSTTTTTPSTTTSTTTTTTTPTPTTTILIPSSTPLPAITTTTATTTPPSTTRTPTATSLPATTTTRRTVTTTLSTTNAPEKDSGDSQTEQGSSSQQGGGEGGKDQPTAKPADAGSVPVNQQTNPAVKPVPRVQSRKNPLDSGSAANQVPCVLIVAAVTIGVLFHL